MSNNKHSKFMQEFQLQLQKVPGVALSVKQRYGVKRAFVQALRKVVMEAETLPNGKYAPTIIDGLGTFYRGHRSGTTRKTFGANVQVPGYDVLKFRAAECNRKRPLPEVEVIIPHG